MNVSLTPELEKLVQDKVTSGLYQTASEVIREALRLLKERDTRYVIFHLQFYDAPSRRRVLTSIDEYRPYLRPLWQKGDEWLFEIVGFPD